jgi:hypothetical protein
VGVHKILNLLIPALNFVPVVRGHLGVLFVSIRSPQALGLGVASNAGQRALLHAIAYSHANQQGKRTDLYHDDTSPKDISRRDLWQARVIVKFAPDLAA